MTTVGTNAVTLLDVARRTVDKKIAKLIEVLHDTNEILQDIMWMSCNDGDSHVVSIRTGLPSVAWKRFNYGVAQSKGQSQTVKEATGMLRAYSKVDKDLADKNGNAAEFRASEDVGFLEAMNQELATTLFYGNTNTHPEKFNGFSMRYVSPSSSRREIGYNMINGGGAGATNTSVWLVGWGEMSCFGLYPESERAGFDMNDLGTQLMEDANGLLNRYYVTEYSWRVGLCVKDWRHVVRICNIDMTTFDDAGESTFDGPAILQLMIRAIRRRPPTTLGRPVFYMNGDLLTALDLISNFDNRLCLKVTEVDGQPITSFRGIPIRRCDALINTEAAVPFA
jgi:hypothetical protein